MTRPLGTTVKITSSDIISCFAKFSIDFVVVNLTLPIFCVYPRNSNTIKRIAKQIKYLSLILFFTQQSSQILLSENLRAKPLDNKIFFVIRVRV
jgi:hypothetical protein